MPLIYRFPFSIQQGSFQSPTTTGLFEVDGLPFAPQLVLFFGPGRVPADESGVLNDCGSFFGAASVRDGVITQWVTNHYQKDNVNPTQAVGKNSQSLCISLPESTTTFYFQASFFDILGDGFILNFTDVDPLERTIYYYAIGGLSAGADIVCGTMTNTAVVGHQSVTGLGFQPDALIWKHDFVSGTVHDDLGVAVNSDTSSDWCVSMFSVNGVSPSSTREIFDMDRRCIMNWGNGATQCEIEMVSYDTDGFTINKITQDGITRPYNFIAIKGIQANAGTFISASSTVTTREVAGLGFSPFLLLIAGSNQISTTASMTQIADTVRSYGVSRSPAQQVTYGYSETNGVATSECGTYFNESHILGFLNATSSPSLQQRGLITSFNPDGFTVRFDLNDAIARRCFYLALGGTANGGRDSRRIIDGMDIAPNQTHYMTVPHFSNEVGYSDWTVYIFKNGERLTDVPYDIRENPLGSYTFSFINDGDDEAQWTLIAYETASPNDRYVEAWRVKSKAAEAAIFDLATRQASNSGGTGSNVGGSAGTAIGRT